MDQGIFAIAEARGHEQITYFNYPQVGLKAIVAIHDTTLGFALGGCRMRLYKNEAEALEDAMRLSEGMTYKSAMAGLPLGGGKSCIIADPQMKEGRKELFEQFGKCLNDLAGRYVTAEDMGTSVKDIMFMKKYSNYAAGFSKEEGGGGDPSPWTARGVFCGILAAAEFKYGSKDLRGKKISIQGVGNVGMYLLEHLSKAGAKCVVCDTRQSAVEEAHRLYGAEVVSCEQIYNIDCDIFSPNAIGQTINIFTIPLLRCSIIAGGANNQLSDNVVYDSIEKKGILYCPDFVINAGGIISVGAEYNKGGWKEDWVRNKTENVGNTVRSVIEEAKKRGQFPEVTAIALAKEKVAAAKR